MWKFILFQLALGLALLFTLISISKWIVQSRRAAELTLLAKKKREARDVKRGILKKVLEEARTRIGKHRAIEIVEMSAVRLKEEYVVAFSF